MNSISKFFIELAIECYWWSNHDLFSEIE